MTLHDFCRKFEKTAIKIDDRIKNTKLKMAKNYQKLQKKIPRVKKSNKSNILSIPWNYKKKLRSLFFSRLFIFSLWKTMLLS